MELRQKRPTYEVAEGGGHIISSHQDMHPGHPGLPGPLWPLNMMDGHFIGGLEMVYLTHLTSHI